MMKLWQFLSVILILSISPLEISGQNNSGIVSGSVFNSGQEPLVGVSVFTIDKDVDAAYYANYIDRLRAIATNYPKKLIGTFRK